MSLKNQKPVEWNGKVYRSQKAAAKALGITEAAMSKRIKNGWSCDEDIPKRTRGYDEAVERGQLISAILKGREV